MGSFSSWDAVQADLGRQKSKLEKAFLPSVFPTTKMILQNDTMPSNKKREVPRRRKGCDVSLVSVRFRHWIRRRKEGRRGQDGWRFFIRVPEVKEKKWETVKRRVCVINFLPASFFCDLQFREKMVRPNHCRVYVLCCVDVPSVFSLSKSAYVGKI